MVNDLLGGRLSLLKRDGLSESQQKIYDQLQNIEVPWAKKSGFKAETDDGELIGPFNAMLRSPEIASGLMGLTHALEKKSVLSERVRQVIILTVGAAWQSSYELYAHTAVARHAGLTDNDINALKTGQKLTELSPDESLAHVITHSITVSHQISPDSYQQAVKTFGEQGTVDMLVLAGHYMIVCSLLNAFSVPAPVAHEESTNNTNQSEDGQLNQLWTNMPVRVSRRGNFWIAGERVVVKGKTFQCGPMFVSWEAPQNVTQPYPVVLVHGGATQATEWLDTPDGRPGWAQRFVEAGYAVFTIDRPTQGRSSYHPDVAGKMGPAFSYEEGEEVFFPPAAKDHTQFPFNSKDDAAIDTFIAQFGPLPEDIKAWQEMDAGKLAKLLDKIGPAIIITHSASGSDGWLIADRRPELVKAIITVEPMGPAFGTTPGIGTLDWGLTAIPVTYEPEMNSAKKVKKANPTSLKIPSLKNMPVAVVSGETSVQSKYAPEIVEFLKNAGANVELLHLPDYGIFGNGHGLIYEKNSDEALQPVLRWLQINVSKNSHLYR